MSKEKAGQIQPGFMGEGRRRFFLVVEDGPNARTGWTAHDTREEAEEERSHLYGNYPGLHFRVMELVPLEDVCYLLAQACSQQNERWESAVGMSLETAEEIARGEQR